ncbi:MAG: PAS domain S-box protein, partial [Spirochaetaceae bacterium]|nr:PAS domain S-box protein [Spirochaetaceae bacterium]
MPKPISDPSQLRILIIEDNSDDAFLIANAIRKSYPDAEFLEAPGRSEFESVLASGQHLDIILSDWSLPQFSGLEALARIQTLGITVPFIIVSGKIGEEAAIAAIRQGAYDYVLKDNLGRLSNAISHALLLHESKEKARQDQMRITLQAKALQAASVAIALLDKDKTIEVVNPAFEKLTGYEESEVLGRNATEFCLDPDCLQHAELFADGNSEKDFSSTAVEQKKDGSLYFEERKVCPVTDQDGQINHFVLIKQNITAIEQAREEFALQVSYTAATRQARTPEALCNATISFIREQSEKVHAGICLYTDGTTACKKWYGENMQGIVPDQNNFLHEVNLTDEKIGVLALSFTSPLPYNLNKLFMITAGQFENYLNRLVIQQRTTAQIRHLSFLKLISRTISTVMDFDEVMKPLLVQTKTLLDSDAVALYLFDGQRNSFVCRASEGFRYNLIKNAVIPLGQPNVGLAAEKQQMTIVSNFDNVDPRSQFGNLVEKEEFRSQYCVPIIIGGKSFGVLEIFQRKAFAASQEWLSLFDAIALQMGLALDYNNLYDKLQKAYLDLEDSYEATLEG